MLIKGTKLDISLLSDGNLDHSRALERAKQIVADIERYRKLVADYAASWLLHVKNDAWLKKAEKEMSADEFKARLVLEAITVESNGGATFWYRESKLFLGHSVHVEIDTNDECVVATI